MFILYAVHEIKGANGVKRGMEAIPPTREML